tara:strand:+ start:21151 stop:22329 length:1179 start_codon:yes stop_codon:yes gene_type:complete
MTLVNIATVVDLDVEVPDPISGTWLGDIKSAASAAVLRDRLAERFPVLADGKSRRLAILGAADEGRRLAAIAENIGIEVVAIADDNPNRLSTIVGDLKVSSTSDLSLLDADVPVIIASHRPLQSVQRLREMGFETVTMFATLQVLAPDRFPPHMFYDGWLEDLSDNVGEYERLMERLDETSQAHLQAILGFRQTMEIGAIAPVIDWAVYEPKGLLSFDDKEVYVDAGTFDGDSIRLFIDRMGEKFERVIGFEPDPKTYAALKENFLAEKRVECVNKGLYDRSGTMQFVNDASRGAILGENGCVTVDITSLDEHVGADRISFIKMNIEGAELEALKGAENVIGTWKPKLAISAYHRPSDLWKVPALILNLNESYELAIRQHDAGVIETVAYAF